MQRSKRLRHGLAAAAAIGLIVVALAVWQWPALTRFAVVTTSARIAHVRLSFASSAIGWQRATFTGVRAANLQGAPLAAIHRVTIGYDLRDLLPGGRRLYGLRSIDVDRPRITIVRYADGRFDVAVPHLAPRKSGTGPPLDATVTVAHGSIAMLDRSPNGAPSGHLFVKHLDVAASIATQARSHYAVSFSYGERAGKLYPVHGEGTIDESARIMNQRWTAREIPLVGAVDFAINSPSLRMQAGALYGIDARIFGMPAQHGMEAHVAATAFLRNARIAVAGLSAPITGIRGRIDASEQGVLAERLDAKVGSIPAVVAGGVIDPLRRPRLRLSVSGKADASDLRSVVAQAARLPVRGPLAFSILAEGSASSPLTWISLRSARIGYGALALDDIRGLVAFDGREADVIALHGRDGSIALNARGRVGLRKAPHAIRMLVGVRVPPGSVAGQAILLPNMSLDGVALATARDPKAVGVRGVLDGIGPGRSLDATFDVAPDGVGSVGPLYASSARGSLYARVALDRPHGRMRGFVAANDWSSGSGDVTAAGGFEVAGSASRGTFAMVVRDGSYRNEPIDANAAGVFAHQRLAIRSAAAQIGPAFVTAAGTVANLALGRPFAPHYDLHAAFHTSDASTLVALVAPHLAPMVQGSLDLRARVRGSGFTPSVTASLNAPEGSVNGLAFRNLHASIGGDAQQLVLSNGSIIVGSTVVAFSGSEDRSNGVLLAAMHAPRTNLADFDDFFDTGDTLSGTGRMRANATIRNGRVDSSRASAAFVRARFRRIDVGTLAAGWYTAPRGIVARLAFGGTSGRVRIAALVPRAFDVANPARSVVHEPMLASFEVNDLDTGTWLPMLGLALPVTGRLDATGTFSGMYPDVSARLQARLRGGHYDRISIQRFQLAMSASHGRGTLQSLVADVPDLTTTAWGTFGLHANDPLALVVRSQSSDVGTLLAEATGKRGPLTGTLDSTLRVRGSRAAPIATDDFSMQSVRYGHFAVPRISATLTANRTTVALQRAEADLVRGKLLLSATLPLASTGLGASAPIRAMLIADALDASDAAAFFPKGTHLTGQVDGTVQAAGTLRAPQLAGNLVLTRGSFIGPLERAPIDDATATLAFEGTHVFLRDVHASIGGGSLAASGNASVQDLRSLRGLSFALRARADNAHVEIPNEFTGNLSGEVAMSALASSPIDVSGDVSVRSARIPVSALYNPKASKHAAPALPPIAFENLRMTAGKDVRVQGDNVDVGLTGAATLGGSLRAPQLNGAFSATGGTLDFYRNFTLRHARVAFSPQSGIIPYVDATATTYVSNPSTAIRLHVNGPATNMNLTLASDPSYDKEQILGLLVGAQQFGAVAGVPNSKASGDFSLPGAAESVALGQVNTIFARNLLEPLSSSIGTAMGFTNMQITSDLQTGLGLNAVKAFGKHVNAIVGENFGYPRTQSVALQVHSSVATALMLRVYSSQGPTLMSLQQPQTVMMGAMNINPLTAVTQVGGTSGVDFSLERTFPR